MDHLGIVQSLPSITRFALLRSCDAVQSNSVIGVEPPPCNRFVLDIYEKTQVSDEPKLSRKRKPLPLPSSGAPRRMKEAGPATAVELAYGLADPVVKQLSLQDVKVNGRGVGRVKIDAPPQVVSCIEQEKDFEDPKDGVLKRRLARARHRDRSYGHLKSSEEIVSLSFLEHNAVKKETAQSYSARLEEFKIWLHSNGIRPLSVSHLDVVIVEYFEDLFFQGFNHDEGEKLLASIGHFSPQLGRRTRVLSRSLRALRGWTRLMPGRSRAPAPYPLLMLLVIAALHLKMGDLAAAMIIQFHAYLRPGELLKLRPWQISKAVVNGVSSYALILSDEKLTGLTKTGEKNDSVVLDWAYDWMGPILDRLRRRPPDSIVWTFTSVEYGKMISTCAELAGMLHLGVHPYGLRHGGASWDAFKHRRSLEAIKSRGRWQADSSVRRYQKDGRVVKEMEKMGVVAIKAATRIEELLFELMSGLLLPFMPLTLLGPKLARRAT